MGKLSDYHYHLPQDCIAQHPLERRDHSRLMVMDRADGALAHHQFSELPTLLRPDDVLVINNTRVVPARLLGRKASGGKIEALALGLSLHHQTDKPGTIFLDCLIKASKAPQPGTAFIFDQGVEARVTARRQGQYTLAFTFEGDSLSLLEKIGRVPLPPYIHRGAARDNGHDRETYQTVYAAENGAVAAPTAGLHFTPQLLTRLAGVGIETIAITLHVGYGTFEPVRVEDIDDHRMHAEAVRVTKTAARQINAARAQGRRIVAVGTTSVRTLEWAAGADGRLRPLEGPCDLFIKPGCRFKAVDAMITNFHLPQSTLLMLVSAFAGRERILAAYRTAVARNYRFFSYGDAMLLQ